MASMTTTPNKRGRKAKDFVAPWDGKTVNGLYKKPGTNVWRIRDTGREFTEVDERLAVKRFFEEAAARKPKVTAPLIAAEQTLEGIRAAGSALATAIESSIDEAGRIRFDQKLDERWMYGWMREAILTDRKKCATMTGIAWLEWGPQLTQPEGSHSLKELGDLYAAKAGMSANEVGRSKLFWAEFTRAVGVDTVRELTHEAVERYERIIGTKGLAPKSILHRYRKVRTIFHFAIKRGKSIEECRKALDVLAMLEVKGTQPLDPKPIAPEAFWRLYKAAKDAKDETFAALMVFALNACLYSSEVAAVKWDDVDLKAGEFVCRRNKTQVPRVAVLWPQTAKLLKALPRQGEYIFYTSRRSYTTFSVLEIWRRYREAAGYAKEGDEVTFSQIRDAAYSIACRVSTFDKARVLSGHRLPGAADNYILRNPRFVEDACDAVHTAFAVAKHVK